MSVSEILVPNTLNLYCNSITQSTLTPIDFNTVLVNQAHYEGNPLEVKGRQVSLSNVDKCIGIQTSTNISDPDDYSINIIRTGSSNDFSLDSVSFPNMLFIQGSTGKVCINSNFPQSGYELSINGAVNMNSDCNVQGSLSSLELTVADVSSLPTVVSVFTTTTDLTATGMTSLSSTTTSDITSTIGLTLPNTVQSSTGTQLQFYESIVIPTNFTDAIASTASNLRLTRIGKSVNLSIDGIAFQTVLSTDPIRCSAAIPNRFFPNFSGTSMIAYFNFYLNYSDINYGVLATLGVIAINTSGGIEIFINQPLQIQSPGLLGLTTISTFGDSNGMLPPLSIQVGWDSVNISYYCAV